MEAQFPITVFFEEDGESWAFDDRDEIARNLEYFDSEDPAEHASVTDASGRRVRLRVEHLQVILCEVADDEAS